MNSRLFFLAFLAAASLGFSNPAPAPQLPSVASPSPGVRWEIAVEALNSRQGEAIASPNRRPILICGEKVGDVTRIEVSWNDGSTAVAYICGNQYVYKFPRTGRVATIPVQDGDLLEPVFVSGYPATAWIGKTDYQGIENFGSEECYKYHRDASTHLINGETISTPEFNAWIRTRDSIPACIQLGGLLYRYRPVTLAPSPFEIPPDIRLKLNQLQTEQRVLQTTQTSSSNLK